MSRDYEWPSQVKTPHGGFAFGLGSNRCESAKDLLFPTNGAMEEKPEFSKMYEKTHGNVPAGQQRSREYNWTVDPQTHVFGFGEQAQPNQAARAIHSERYDAKYPQTTIVKKQVEDVKAVQQDHLGTARNLGQGLHPSITEEMCFGAPSLKDPQEWNAAKCMAGQPSERELMPDNDLGRCVKPGSRNMVRTPQDVNRAFGCPTIRTDIPLKEFRSVADH